VTCTIKPKRAKEDRPSNQPIILAGNFTDSSVVANAKVPGCKKNASPSGTIISSLITDSSWADTSSFGPLKSMKGAECSRNTRKELPKRTSIVAPLILSLDGRGFSEIKPSSR